MKLMFRSIETSRQDAEQAREVYARQVFDPERIDKGIKDAAAYGLNSLRLHQGRPVSLNMTMMAMGLVQRLTAQGYRVTWQPAAQPELVGKRNTGRYIDYVELVIEWEWSARGHLEDIEDDD